MAATVNPAEPVVFSRLADDNSCRLAVGGREITLRHRPTKEWLDALAEQELHRIMPGMLRERDVRWWIGQLADPRVRFDVSDSHKIAHAVVREVTGLPWWAAARLANAAGRSWFLADPTALLRGVNLLQVSIRRALSVIYVFAAEGCEKDRDRAVLDADLFRPPEGTQNPWTAVQQAASFAAFRQATGMLQRPGAPTATPEAR